MKTNTKAPRIGLIGVKFDTRRELLVHVKAYLAQAYEFDGNDIILETMSDDEMIKAMGKSRTLSGAIWAIRENQCISAVASVRDEHIAMSKW